MPGTTTTHVNPSLLEFGGGGGEIGAGDDVGHDEEGNCRPSEIRFQLASDCERG